MQYADETPDIQIKVHPAGGELPPTVFLEVMRILTECAQPIPEAHINPGSKQMVIPATNQDCGQIGSNFECSTITIGHSPEEEQAALEQYCGPGDEKYWPNVQGGRPVAHWRSGISQGCDQELFLMPDGSFEWTEP